MKLFFREYGDGPPVVLLHGLLASSDNWFTIARLLSDTYRVIAPDLRNHGVSPHSDDFDFSLLSADIRELIERLNLRKPFIVGHSLGGKTAMELSLSFPDIPRAVVLEDIIPGETVPISGRYIRLLQELDLGKVVLRRDAEERLLEKEKDRRVVRFLLKNLLRNEDGIYTWKANLDALLVNYEKLWKGLESDRSWDGPALFIRGGQSDVVPDESFEEILSFFPRAQIVTIGSTGHWVHGDAADEFVGHLRRFFSSV